MAAEAVAHVEFLDLARFAGIDDLAVGPDAVDVGDDEADIGRARGHRREVYPTARAPVAGSRFIVRNLLDAGARLPVICAVNKADRLGPNELVPVLSDAAEMEGVDEVFPISAKSGEGSRR